MLPITSNCIKKKTVIISPLIALIDDQIAGLRDYGVSVEALHSNLSFEDTQKSWTNFKEGKSKIIYIVIATIV